MVLCRSHQLPLPTGQRRSDGVPGKIGPIVHFTQVGKYQQTKPIEVRFVQQSGCLLVVEMAQLTSYASLEAPGVGPGSQHLQVVVTFQQQSVAGTETIHHKARDMTQISQNTQAVAPVMEHKLTGLSRVMRHDHRLNNELSNLERLMRIDQTK